MKGSWRGRQQANAPSPLPNLIDAANHKYAKAVEKECSAADDALDALIASGQAQEQLACQENDSPVWASAPPPVRAAAHRLVQGPGRRRRNKSKRCAMGRPRTPHSQLQLLLGWDPNAIRRHRHHSAILRLPGVRAELVQAGRDPSRFVKHAGHLVSLDTSKCLVDHGAVTAYLREYLA